MQRDGAADSALSNGCLSLDRGEKMRKNNKPLRDLLLVDLTA